MLTSFMVVDNFYPDPHLIRETALQGEYFESERYVGLDCDQKLLHKELDGAVSRLVGQKVRGNLSDMGNHGRFRVTLGHHRNNEYMAGIHVDSNDCIWAGLVCLALDKRDKTDDITPFLKEALTLSPTTEDVSGIGRWKLP